MAEGRRWEDLHTDCLANIFSKLDLEDLTLSVPFVCKPWLDASTDVQCWKVLNLRDIDLMPWSSFGRRFKQAYNTKRFSVTGLVKALIDRGNGSTVELAFPSDRFAALKELEYASTNCPKLKVLALPELFQQEDKHIPEFVRKWKGLEFLTLTSKPSSFVEIIEQIGINCKNFKGITLSGRIGNDDASAIVKHIPKLKHLAMSGCFLSKSGLLSILDGCKQLEMVDVSSCTGFDVDDEILKAASGVNVFECEGAKMEEDRMDYCHDDAYWGMIC